MALAGLGNCVFHPVDFSILNARVSAPRLGHAYAAHGISGNLGWALAPVFVVGIAQGTGSWRMALFAVAGLAFGVVAVVVACGWWCGPHRRPAWQRAHRRWPRRSAAAAQAAVRFPAPAGGVVVFRLLPHQRRLAGAVQTFAPPRRPPARRCRPRRWPCACRSSWSSAPAGMVLGGTLARDPRRSASIVAIGFGLSAWWRCRRLHRMAGAGGAGAVRHHGLRQRHRRAVARPARQAGHAAAAPPGASMAWSIRGWTSARRRCRC